MADPAEVIASLKAKLEDVRGQVGTFEEMISTGELQFPDELLAQMVEDHARGLVTTAELYEAAGVRAR